MSLLLGLKCSKKQNKTNQHNVIVKDAKKKKKKSRLHFPDK